MIPVRTSVQAIRGQMDVATEQTLEIEKLIAGLEDSILSTLALLAL